MGINQNKFKIKIVPTILTRIETKFKLINNIIWTELLVH